MEWNSGMDYIYTGMTFEDNYTTRTNLPIRYLEEKFAKGAVKY